MRIPIAASKRSIGDTPYYGANGIQDYVSGFTHDGEFVLVAEDGANDLNDYPIKHVSGKIWVNNHAHVIQGKENICNNSFLARSLKKANICSVLVGGGRAKLNSEIMMKLEIHVPTLEEQRKVGSIFEKVDNTITLHQRKVESLKQLKKYLLQKMFPKNGETKPEIRFKNFTGDWEQRKLADICRITMGQSPDGVTYSAEPSDYILVQGNADLKDGWVYPRVWTTQKTKLAQAGDLIMSVRAPAGAMGKTAFDAVIGRGVASIKGNEFIYQTLVKYDSDGYWKN